MTIQMATSDFIASKPAGVRHELRLVPAWGREGKPKKTLQWGLVTKSAECWVWTKRRKQGGKRSPVPTAEDLDKHLDSYNSANPKR
ncbi:Hypothetical protein FKW44_002718, partial [Caligus rogercresseyi]